MVTIREVHIATVVDNDDPEIRFRLKVAGGTLMGTDDDGEVVEYGDWIEPSFPVLLSSDGENVTGGFFAIPGPGTTVEIELAVSSDFDEAPNQTLLTNSDPRWRASLFQLGDDIPDEFKTNYPNRFGFKSATGHLFLFDDSEGDLGKVMIAARPNALGQQSFMSFENDGSIQIITNNGMMFFMNADKGEITLLDSQQNMIALKADGTTIMAKGGHTIDMNAAGINVLAAGALHLQGNSVTAQGLTVALGDSTAVEFAVLGTSQVAALITEFAAIAASLASNVPPPTITYTPAFVGSLSPIVKVK